jgi:hypothetical protein
LLDSKKDDSRDKEASAKQNAAEGADTELSDYEDD